MRWRSALLLGSMLLPGPVALADDAAAPDQLLQQVEVSPLSDGARVVVHFSCPLRYTSHFPSKSLTELRISLAAQPECGSVAAPGNELRAPTGNAAGLASLRLEPAGSALVLTLEFNSLVDVMVRPTPDLLGVEIGVIGGAPGRRPSAGVTLTPRQTAAAAPRQAAARPLPPPAVLEAQWLQAKAAFDRGDYQTAVRLMTRLTEYPEHPHRAEAQERLGLARERDHQLAQAKAEYEEYLRRYPDGPAAARVRQRLAALLTLGARPRVAAVAGEKGGMQWTSFGGWSQDYWRDSTSLKTSDTSQSFLSQDMIVSNADYSLRGRGERFDVQTRFNGGYMYDMLANGPGNRSRLSLAYAEIDDRTYGLSARLGRQSQHRGGVLGTFDGLTLGWQVRDTLRVNLMTGFPLDSTRDGFSTLRRFFSLSANWSGGPQGLEISPYLIRQTYDGLADRQAVGTELRWYAPGRTLVSLLDYDIDYRALNMALLLGSIDLPGRWTATGTLDHRKSPFLTTRNALAGQPVRSIADLVAQYGEAGVRALALDRTAQSDSVSFGVSHPLGTRLQWNADVTESQLSSMPASGGVPAIPGTGAELSIGTQLIATNLVASGDMSIISLRRYQGSTATTNSLAVSSRFPVFARFRFSPRLRLDQRYYAVDGSNQWLISPSLLLDWHRKATTVEFQAGGELGSRNRAFDQERTSRYWFNLGYRVGF